MITTFLDNVIKVNITFEKGGQTKLRIFYNQDGQINNHCDIDLFPKEEGQQVLIETCGVKIK